MASPGVMPSHPGAASTLDDLTEISTSSFIGDSTKILLSFSVNYSTNSAKRMFCAA
jgi:hypothetical protein